MKRYRYRIGTLAFVAVIVIAPIAVGFDIRGMEFDPADAVVRSNGEDGTFTAVFFGDMMLERRLEPVIAEHGIAYLFDGVRTLPDGRALGEIDLVSANLEGAITEGGVHSAPVYPYDFAFSPERVAAAIEAGIDYFTIANNHLWDQGADGVASTRTFLDRLGAYYSGDVDAALSAHSTTVIEVRGTSVAMVALSAVYNYLDGEAVRELVRAADAQSDVTIVNIHWGIEYEHVASAAQRRFAALLVSAGADLVIGHHPHVVQGVEMIEGVAVFYSLGNFIFDQAFSEETQEGLGVSVTISPDRLVFELLPFRSSEYQPGWRTGEDRTSAFREIASWSFVDDRTREALRRGRFIARR